MQIAKAFAQLALSNPKILNNIVREAERLSVDALRPLPRLTPRFEVRFVNGIWTIFDRWTFRNCEPGLPSEKAARALLEG
jgi:hypothetical protein